LFWAHSDRAGLAESDPRAHWQPLAEHLRNVGRIAGELAAAARPCDSEFQRVARAVGMLHDIGKYAPSFQDLIRGKIRKDPGGHAARGASLAWLRKWSGPAAFAIVGHHSGIPNCNDGTGSMVTRSRDAEEQADKLWNAALTDCPELSDALEGLPLLIKKRGIDLSTRMLFSCLVDADRLDTASRSLSAESLRPEERLASLLKYIDARAAGVSEGIVKTVRAQVLRDCLAAGTFPENLLSLTVPTGGGKTLASLALALQRAIEQPGKVRRIIVVIPYLSIIEQNAQVFADALGAGAVLEHHSGNFERLKVKGDQFIPQPKEIDDSYSAPWKNPATENWDAPIVVTTSVRFFESLFSNRPSDLRRLHNVARSVVILDEVQTLPRKFLNPLLSAMKRLAKDWDTTFVFCTATQPAFEKPVGSDKSDPRWDQGTVREVIPNAPDHFQALRRVAVDWQIKEPSSWPRLAAVMLESGQALAIVNVRDHAAQLFQAMKSLAPEEPGLFHLSTRMCAAHRLEKFAQIRERLAAKERCVVASTQLIEAGVDLDFPAVFRALAPLDSIVQAAGRCDREGRLTKEQGKPGGKLVVFRTEDGKTPPHEYKEATDITRNMAKRAPLSIDDPAVMHLYFHKYYGEADALSLGAGLEAKRDDVKFRDVAEEFEMISDYTQDVFVCRDEKSRAAIAELDAIGTMTSELRRKLQRYVVGLNPSEFLQARRGAVRQIRDTDCWVCVDGFYTDDLGIVIAPAAASMVI